MEEWAGPGSAQGGVTNSKEVVFGMTESKVTSWLMKVGESSLGTSGGSRRPG